MHTSPNQSSFHKSNVPFIRAMHRLQAIEGGEFSYIYRFFFLYIRFV